MSSLDQKLNYIIEPVVAGMGYEFVGLNYFPQGKYTLLRVYIDKKTGVNSDDCGEVSHQISGVLDVEDLISGQYNLEVSSPGLDRPLFKIEHFRKFIGSKVKITFRTMIVGRRKIKGIILTVDQETITIEDNGISFTLTIEQIDRARIVSNIDWKNI